MSKIRLGIHGAAGRMGQRLIALGSQDADFELAAAIDWDQNPNIGKDAGVLAGVGEIGVPLTSGIPYGLDVIIDFSLPSGAVSVAEGCQKTNTALVMATTGLEPDQQARVDAAIGNLPFLTAPNMSLAVNLAMKLSGIAGEAAKDAPGGVDVEILERHHRMKEDSPSGTALKFGQIISDAMGQTVHTHGREGRVGARPLNEIGYHAIRTGDNPGEHTIVYGFLGETIEITVRATNRDAYANGALAAAKFLHGKPVGSYNMADVLGL